MLMPERAIKYGLINLPKNGTLKPCQSVMDGWVQCCLAALKQNGFSSMNKASGPEITTGMVVIRPATVDLVLTEISGSLT
ncbi:hypothetical protein D3C86_1675240 [compost metagenome]